jgi:hypothetical protein
MVGGHPVFQGGWQEELLAVIGSENVRHDLRIHPRRRLFKAGEVLRQFPAERRQLADWKFAAVCRRAATGQRLVFMEHLALRWMTEAASPADTNSGEIPTLAGLDAETAVGRLGPCGEFEP